jgi:hypothetical protein
VKWLESNVEFLGNGILEANKCASMNLCLCIFPVRFCNRVKPCLKQDLDIDVNTKSSSLVIALTP